MLRIKKNVAAWLKSTGRALLLTVIAVASANAAVLPEDPGDVLYQSYSGGDVEVTGPSLLVRKSLDTNTVQGFELMDTALKNRVEATS